MVRTLDRTAVAAAASLSVLAGYLDGFGFLFLGGFFVSFMSGNTTRASVGLAEGGWATAGLAAALIAAFVAGAAAGTLLARGRAGGGIRILALVAALVATAGLGAVLGAPPATGVLLAGAMGAMNTVFARGGEVSFGVTYMTGALVKLGQALAVVGDPARRRLWVRPFLLWAAIAVGAVLGAVAFTTLGTAAIWPPVGVLAVLLAVPAARRWFTG